MGMIKRGDMWYTDDWDGGHRIRRALDKNKRIADSLYADFRESLRARRLGLIPKNTTLKNFEQKYLDFRKSEKTLKTWRDTKLAFARLHEMSDITRLGQITPELLEDLKIRWKEKYSPASVTGYVVALKTAMRIAEAWKYVAPQVWKNVQTYKPSPKLHYYTIEQLREVLGLCREPFYTAALLMGRAGLRSGEVRHLHWPDINFDSRTIWVHGKACNYCRECKHRGGHWQVKGTRPGKKPKERYVDIPKDLEHHLRYLQNRSGLVLGPEMVSEATYWHYFLNLTPKAGFDVGAHKFRHTYGAHLASAGVSLIAIGELMGHSNPMTTQIYAHLLPHARRSAVDMLPSLGS